MIHNRCRSPDDEYNSALQMFYMGLILLSLVALMYSVLAGHMRKKVREVPHQEKVVRIAPKA